jgi:hypothetical protein
LTVLLVVVEVVPVPVVMDQAEETQAVETVVGQQEICQLLELQTLAVAVVVVEIILAMQLLLMVQQVVQVTHELFIGVNYGTTLRIS